MRLPGVLAVLELLVSYPVMVNILCTSVVRQMSGICLLWQNSLGKAMCNRMSHLHKVYQITQSKKYVISIYERFDFPNFQSFPAPSSVSAACAENTNDFLKL